jgi:hypothetical protein
LVVVKPFDDYPHKSKHQQSKRSAVSAVFFGKLGGTEKTKSGADKAGNG